jgi:peptidoglycan/LPS O-acetylase OafA/YrhL
LGARPVNLRNYFLRRLTRLEPPYLISLLLIYELRNLFARGWLHGGHLLAGIFYLHWLRYGYPNPINPVAWSLEVEVQFYLLVPLLTMVFILPPRARRSILALCILLSLAVNCISDFTPLGYTRVFQWSLAGYLHFFLLGFLFADLYLCSKLNRSTIAWDVLTVAAIVFVVYGHIYRYTDETTSAVGLAIIFAAAFLGKWSRKILRYPWIATIGGMCYSIYLIHHFVLQAISEGFAHHPMLGRGGALEYTIAALLLLPLVIVISGVFFVLVERPCMDPEWPQKLVRAVRGRRLAPERIP